MEKMKYIASVSFGKDSLVMLLKIIELKMPLDEVIFYNRNKSHDLSKVLPTKKAFYALSYILENPPPPESLLDLLCFRS